MKFGWLPDAALDPHPRLTWLAECCFDLAVLALFHKEEIYPADYRLEAGMLIVSNHQRDADVPILTTTLCRREGLHIRWPLPFYATREDLFRRGILADLLAEWPAPVPQILRCIALPWLLGIVRAEPMRRVREFTLGETLGAVTRNGMAQRHPGEVFNARGDRELAAGLGDLPDRVAAVKPHRLGRLRRTFWGLRRLRREALGALEPEFKATIAQQLSRFASHLDAGRIVYFAPEGTISASGRFGRIRSGAWRLYHLAERAPPVLPCTLSYDPLASGKLRVVVHVGTTLREMPTHNKRSFDARLRREILGGYAVTASHLSARFLAAGPKAFSSRDFAEWLARGGAEIRRAGLVLGPLIDRAPAEALADERLEWLARKRLVERTRYGWRRLWSPGATPGWSEPARIVPYLDTAFGEVCELAPGLGRRLQP